MKVQQWMGLASLLVVSVSGADTLSVQPVGPPTTLTPEGVYYMAPKWSPQGGAIAVTGAHYAGIYLVDYPSGDIVQLADDPAAGFGMAWSHDGTEIAARVARYENRRRLNAVAVIDVITGGKQLAIEYVASLPGTPRWTRDDNYIYMTGTSKFQLWSSGRTLRKGTTYASEERVVYVKGDRIQARDVGAQAEATIRQAGGRILNLAISPDGNNMAYEVMGGSIWVSGLDGSDAVDLGTGDGPAWSPDSRKIAYAVTTDDGHRILSADINVVNIDGTGRVNLTQSDNLLEMHPSWSPDGRWIAYSTMTEGRILVQEVR